MVEHDTNPENWRAINLANWNSRVGFHEAGYRLDAFRSDPHHLSDVVRFDLPRLPALEGLTGVHLQCHIGTDTLSLARLGARMSGLDFSQPALDVATRLAVDCGTSIDYRCADLYDAVEAFGGERFDFVYTGVGALCWLPDVARWAAIVAHFLKPGGRLVYAVCSLQPEEGAPRIGAALARGGIRLAPFSRGDLPALPEALTTDGYVRTHPGLWSDRGGMDGFFIARLERLERHAADRTRTGAGLPDFRMHGTGIDRPLWHRRLFGVGSGPQVSLRIGLEPLFAAFAAEVVDGTLMLGMKARIPRYLHAAHRVRLARCAGRWLACRMVMVGRVVRRRRRMAVPLVVMGRLPARTFTMIFHGPSLPLMAVAAEISYRCRR